MKPTTFCRSSASTQVVMGNDTGTITVYEEELRGFLQDGEKCTLARVLIYEALEKLDMLPKFEQVMGVLFDEAT